LLPYNNEIPEKQDEEKLQGVKTRNMTTKEKGEQIRKHFEERNTRIRIKSLEE